MSKRMARAVALVGLAPIVTSHIIMSNPVPYSQGQVVKSPLQNAAPGSDGSNFPCQGGHGYQVSTENMISVGQQNVLSWEAGDTASHGGGTCQLSVTTDREPTANSVFKVINTWIGGCPTTGKGNDGTNPLAWVMPPEVPNGKATFAWNWISHTSGLPEFYMNCAPITVSNSSGTTDTFNSLPDLFRVNLPSSECGSTPGKNLNIPNPGKYVTTYADPEGLSVAQPTGSGCAAMGQASATGSSVSTASLVPGAVSATTPAAGSSATAAGSSATAYSSSAGGVSLSFPAGSLPTVVAGSSTLATYTTPYGGAAPSGTSAAGVGTCTNNGAIVCNGESQFGLCNSGKVVWQQVSDGTKCEDGQVKKKRSVHRAHRPHVRV